MSAASLFCSVESAAIGDPLAGNGAHAERNLLISWPSKKWGRGMRHASDMSEAVQEAVNNIAGNGRRINLIHRRDQPSHQHRVFLLPEGAIYDVPRNELLNFLTALTHNTTLEHWYTASLQSSLILCCTHGKKDKCCAKFGFKTYQALDEQALQHAHPFDIWQSTHLGGCRLAASVIVFPQRRKYGRISEEHLPRLLDAEAANRPYLPCYRGGADLTPVQQCAQVAALNWLNDHGSISEPSVSHVTLTEPPSACQVSVTWQTPSQQGELRITCEPYVLTRVDSCADFEQGATPSTVWRATHIASKDQKPV
ncbi:MULTISPECIES: sucrase ferredoxin [Halomonas]|uniref:Sucrase ferredoxin n=1 Tax=Halomonas citrativorans TaxID=2742612 RepID=A0ABR9F7T4_9GAMM|nr:sucrase ferredoxin [Halomonas citrativorans]MBE0402553.1 sucrase ferredoxin [Halomonas citrativorans]